MDGQVASGWTVDAKPASNSVVPDLLFSTLLLAAATGDPRIVTEELRSDREMRMERGASPTIIIPPIAPGYASAPYQPTESSDPSAAEIALSERCDLAKLRDEAMPEECGSALEAPPAERLVTVEGALLKILGYETMGASSVTEQSTNLRDADTLAAEAGTGQGARAAEAAAIIASQRGGAPPPPPSPR